MVAMEAEEVSRWKPRRVRLLTMEVAKEGSPWGLERS